MSRPLYRCTVCGTVQPAADVVDGGRTGGERDDRPEAGDGRNDPSDTRETDRSSDDPEGGSGPTDDTGDGRTDEEGDAMPRTLRNVTCRHKFGGCCRMVTMERVPDREWDPVHWELFCFECEYETVAWGQEGFGETRSWACPDCGKGMQVLDVEQSWETDAGT